MLAVYDVIFSFDPLRAHLFVFSKRKENHLFCRNTRGIIVGGCDGTAYMHKLSGEIKLESFYLFI